LKSFIWDYRGDQLTNRQNKLELKSFNHSIIIGCGGIGSWVALDCALTGKFANLVIFDDDDIETSNLNRTPFRVCDIGSQKVNAIFDLIMERRPSQSVVCINEKYSFQRLIELCPTANEYGTIVFDCRDDIYEDLKEFSTKVKIWKLGYDGLELTIDGNPRERHVHGQSQGYTTVPSFVYPSQLIANLIVGHVLINCCDIIKDNSLVDSNKMFNDVITFDTGDLLFKIIYTKMLHEHLTFNLKDKVKESDSEESSKKSKCSKIESESSGSKRAVSTTTIVATPV